MAPIPLHSGNEVRVPVVGQAMSVVISLISVTVLSAFFTQRASAIKSWRRLPFVVWIVFAIYIDSYLFVFVTGILQQAFGVNSSPGICDGAILLCLVCYVSSKFIYVFLVEKAHIVRCTHKRRVDSKLYLFNSVGMLSIYVVVGILNFIFRITRMEDGQCVIGMRGISMIPLISFDAVVNIYLTSLFLIPLMNLYSVKNMNRSPSNYRLRNVALRTFIGALSTLTSSIVNLSVLLGLNGEPGWVCLICCNCDILFSAIVIHWVTSKDNVASTSSLTTPTGPPNRPFGRRGHRRSSSPASNMSERDITLQTVARSVDDLHESDDATTASTTIVKEPKVAPPAVLVTTTIHRESSYRSCESESLSQGSKHHEGFGFPQRPSALPTTSVGSFGATRTDITGGQIRHDNGATNV